MHSIGTLFLLQISIEKLMSEGTHSFVAFRFCKDLINIYNYCLNKIPKHQQITVIQIGPGYSTITVWPVLEMLHFNPTHSNNANFISWFIAFPHILFATLYIQKFLIFSPNAFFQSSCLQKYLLTKAFLPFAGNCFLKRGNKNMFSRSCFSEKN